MTERFGCGKCCYGSRRAARTARDALVHRTDDRSRPIHVYFCDRCKAYHVGHQPKRWAQKLRWQ